MFYEKDERESHSLFEEKNKEKSGTAERSSTGFARRLYPLSAGESNGGEHYRGLTLLAGGGEALRGGRANRETQARSEASRRGGEKNVEEAYLLFSDEHILDAVTQFLAYLREERERYWPEGRNLKEEAKTLFAKFFSPELLNQIRVVALSGHRLANPRFYGKVRAQGALNLPDMAHKVSATFLDVIVFNEQITDRQLFHALVHAAQAHVMGLRFYAELFVRGVMRTRSYSLAPMKAQAFALDARFAANPELPFSVDDEIRAWLNAARY